MERHECVGLNWLMSLMSMFLAWVWWLCRGEIVFDDKS